MNYLGYIKLHQQAQDKLYSVKDEQCEQNEFRLKNCKIWYVPQCGKIVWTA